MMIRNLLKEHQSKLFIGRDTELNLIYQKTSRYEDNWKWLHFYGQGGIGKTSLLRSFATSAIDTHPIYFEGYSGFQKPSDFIRVLRQSIEGKHNDEEQTWAITEAIEAINHFAVSQNGLTLLFDTFEQWGFIEDWLRDEWLPALHPSVKICSAGRFPLGGRWLRSGFIQMIQNIELHPLSENEVRKYANIRGIKDLPLARSLYKFSKGVPLALSLACEIISQKGNTSFLNNLQQKEIIGYMTDELMRDISRPAFQCYLEAAALVWRFDQEILQSILLEEIPAQYFRDFCRLPFVIRHDQSWMLHDSVRQWIYADLKDRKPFIYQTYRLRALDALREREKSQPTLMVDIAVDKIYLQDDDFVRSFSFMMDTNIHISGCNEEDLELCEEHYLNYLHNQSNYIADEVHLENLIRPLWYAAPDSFMTLWNENRMVAFCICSPLRDDTIQILRTNPITAPITTLYNPSKIQYLISIAGVDPELESEINGTVFRALSILINREGEIINLLSSPNWLPFLPLLGYERLECADSRTEKGVVYEAYRLDQSIENFTSKVDRLFSKITLSPAQQNKKSMISLDEVVPHLKKVLKNYHQLHHRSLGPSLQFLLSSEDHDMKDMSLVFQIQEKIENAIQNLSLGTTDDQLLSKIIVSAYIKKHNSHENLAEYFNLSTPTYYRYLKKGIKRLAFELMKPEN